MSTFSKKPDDPLLPEFQQYKQPSYLSDRMYQNLTNWEMLVDMICLHDNGFPERLNLSKEEKMIKKFYKSSQSMTPVKNMEDKHVKKLFKKFKKMPKTKAYKKRTRNSWRAPNQQHGNAPRYNFWPLLSNSGSYNMFSNMSNFSNPPEPMYNDQGMQSFIPNQNYQIKDFMSQSAQQDDESVYSYPGNRFPG